MRKLFTQHVDFPAVGVGGWSMRPSPAVSGTGLATRKSRGVDRHGLIENGLGPSVGGGYESGFVKCHTNARWYFYLCHLRLNAGREKAGDDGLEVFSAGAI